MAFEKNKCGKERQKKKQHREEKRIEADNNRKKH
jgi:hypothetical protein